ncbi:peptidylprolyl isomerase [Aurantiacibacter xanthus]|uniref:Peptidylprolyl isomerase n=1 Tax=Aurantiacibacter xanthus TaxID=1784712 RepID=A0A3A1P4G8_9SPHN|nr:peptidylprolyl isomerase [Aurantiacibacter xanthus]RIV84445.1 peptidylprolyl isomerase [Aurantiacibacter xanthus]
MITLRLMAASLLTLAAPAMAQEEPPAPGSVVAAATPEEWVQIAPEDILVMELSPAADGSARRVVIQLLPPPFSQPWVENIKTLARAHWWDGKSIYRVVDNWVAQWGGGDPELDMDPGPLPEGVVSPMVPYVETWGKDGDEIVLWHPRDYLEDNYADWAQFFDGWPTAYAISADTTQLSGWPVHCYGSVGVARDLAPDTGTGSELYAVIGHAPRQLDRNIAVVGRVIAGIEYLSTLPRGTAEAGVYAERSEDTPIVSVRLASEMSDPPAYEYLDTASDSFARYVEVRANRHDSFYEVPAGGVDVCNVQVPIRPVQ